MTDNGDTMPKATGYARAVRMADAAVTMEREGNLPAAVNAADEALKALDGLDTTEALTLRAKLRERKIALLAKRNGNGNGHKPEAPKPDTLEAAPEVKPDPPAPERTCEKCGKAWPLDAEHFRPAGFGGYRKQCRKCSAGAGTGRPPGRPRAAAKPPAPVQPEPEQPVGMSREIPTVPPEQLLAGLRWVLRAMPTTDDKPGAVALVGILGALCDQAGIGAGQVAAMAAEVVAG